MGCGGSKLASVEEQEKMCAAMCKHASVICLQHVVNACVREKSIKIQAPSAELERLRAAPQSLRAQAAEIEAKAKAGGESVGASAKSMLGGTAGGMMSMVANAAASAASTAGGLAGAGLSAALSATAAGIEASISKLDAQFAQVAGEVAAAKEKEIIATYNDILKNAGFLKTRDMIRGEAPYGEAQYKACPTDNISVKFMNVCGDKIVPALMEVVQDEISKNSVVSTWDSAIEKLNDANAKLAAGNGHEKVDHVKLDIRKYIVEQIVAKFAEAMGKHEATLRADPKDKSPVNKVTFALCFSGQPLFQKHYKEFSTKDV